MQVLWKYNIKFIFKTSIVYKVLFVRIKFRLCWKKIPVYHKNKSFFAKSLFSYNFIQELFLDFWKNEIDWPEVDCQNVSGLGVPGAIVGCWWRSSTWSASLSPKSPDTRARTSWKLALFRLQNQRFLCKSYHSIIKNNISKFLDIYFLLTLTRPIGLPPYSPVAQKIADKRWLIANSGNHRYVFYVKLFS